MNNKHTISHILLLVTGLALTALGIAGTINEFWSGMGSALLILCAARLLRVHRMNDVYREKMETASTDERLQFIRNKAWAWAGYLFVIIVALSVIAFKLAGQPVLALAASGCVCLILALFWISFWILQRKY